MRNRWSLFGSGFIVFLTWYAIVYLVTSGTFTGMLTGFAFGLAAAIGGLILGAAIGVFAHAIDLHSTHRDVRAGDERDGARLSLGKLPLIVPVVRKGDDLGDHATAEPAIDPVPESLPATTSDPASGHADSTDDDSADVAPEEPSADGPDVPVPDHLSTACARFVALHESVAVVAGAGGSVAVGTIDRAANPAEFGELMALVSVLADDGVDVSRVAVSVGPDGLPAAVTFPIEGVSK